MRSGETPVPIPNTTVKTRAAESTILATVWEDRWLPDIKKEVRVQTLIIGQGHLPIDDCLSSQKHLYLENRILKLDFNY